MLMVYGIGLIDFMVKSQVDPDTGDVLPDFGVYNDDDDFYRQFKTPETELEAMFLVKAHAPLNTEAHTYVQTQMSSNKVKFLIDEGQAKLKLLNTKQGASMTPNERNEYLKPYQLTSILKSQMMNLVEENEGANIILKQASRKIKKDKFSAFEYGLYYIKKQEEMKTKKRTRDISKFMFFNK